MGEDSIDHGRRRLLGAVAGGLSLAVGAGTAVRLVDGSSADEDGDGIPDVRERSAGFDRRLAATFARDGTDLDPTRSDLLVDVRSIGEASISEPTREYLRELFDENSIRLHWLEYPTVYDAERIGARYGTTIEGLLVDPAGFYWTEVESFLRDVAFQLVVLPGRESEPEKGKLYSTVFDDYVNGMNVGSRAVVARRTDPDEEAELVLHEIAHLALCHDPDPDNLGVMGREREIDLTEREWNRLRNELHNVNETTGYDGLLKQCLLEEYFSS